MKPGYNRPFAVATGAVLLAGLFALPAHADWVFKFGNHSNVEAKGVVQGVQVIWLKRGQVTDIRATGVWTGGGSTLFRNVNNLARKYTVNFEHLSTPSIQYCVWEVTAALGMVGFEDTVQIRTVLKHEQPGFKCEVGGQSMARYNKDKNQGEGVTQNFTVKNK